MVNEQTDGECREMPDFASMLKCFRLRLGWTQEHLAESPVSA